MNILTALKSSEIADNMVSLFMNNKDSQKYPFYPNIESITPNTQNYPLLTKTSHTITSPKVIREEIMRNYFLRGVFVDISVSVLKTLTNTGAGNVSVKPFSLSNFGFFKLFKYFRILQKNNEFKRIDFNNILDIITNKYESFTADSIFTIGSSDYDFNNVVDGASTVLSGSVFIPFSFTQMSKLCPDTSLLHPLELEISVGSNHTTNGIYEVVYYDPNDDANFETYSISSMTITPRYQFSAIEDIYYEQLKKDLYIGMKSRINLDYGYITYNSNIISGGALPTETNIKLNLGRLVKRYYIRAFIQNTPDLSNNTFYNDGSDFITNIKLCSGSKLCFEYTKSQNQLVSIILGNSYRQTSSNSIFGGYTLDMTNGFLQEKSNEYSSGFPEYYIEDPQMVITTNNPTDTNLYIYITSEYYSVYEIDAKNGIIKLISEK